MGRTVGSTVDRVDVTDGESIGGKKKEKRKKKQRQHTDSVMDGVRRPIDLNALESSSNLLLLHRLTTPSCRSVPDENGLVECGCTRRLASCLGAIFGRRMLTPIAPVRPLSSVHRSPHCSEPSHFGDRQALPASSPSCSANQSQPFDAGVTDLVASTFSLSRTDT